MNKAAGTINKKAPRKPRGAVAAAKAETPHGKASVGSKSRNVSAAPRGEARRKTILRALHRCVLDRGYSKTTLADVAQEAGMYPSHLLYYFNGKEAVLEQYFQDVSEKILERLASLTAEDPQRQIELLTDLFFFGEGITKSEIGFMLECFGVAVNDSVLREEKAELDRKCKEYLERLFEQSPARTMKLPRDCAEVAYSMLIGLRSAVYFDEKLRLQDAYRLFYIAVRNLAGLS